MQIKLCCQHNFICIICFIPSCVIEKPIDNRFKKQAGKGLGPTSQLPSSCQRYKRPWAVGSDSS